ncbi:MAG: prolipoprotein diacylglyceryl transferase, partial [Clostridia bacterium]|nr:prolipoprotein diacylglyceryl transferase [Clostridia bacterium]
GFLLLHFLSKKWYKFYGQYFLLYLGWYGLGRAWIEGLRTDSLWLIENVIRVSQLVAVLCVIAVIPLIIFGLKGKLFKPVVQTADASIAEGDTEAVTENDNTSTDTTEE